MFVVDRVMLGHHSSSALAAMHLAGPFEWSLWSIFSAFSVATVAEVGRHVGGRRPGAAAAVARLSLTIGFGIGTVVAILSPVAILILNRIGSASSPETLNEACGYLQTTLLASPPVFIGIAALAAIQAGGDTRSPLAIGIFVNLIHIALNRVLILGAFGIPSLGAKGAGISTAITFTFEAILAVLVLVRGKGNVALSPSDPIRPQVADLMRVGVPAFVERLFYHAGYLVFAAMVARLGDVAMAAHQGLISCESICFLSADGFGIAAAALVAQKMGAQKAEEADATTKKSVRYATALLSAMGLFFLLTRAWVLPLFSSDSSIVELGARTMPVLFIAQPFMAIGIVHSQALRGAGHTKEVFWVSLISVSFVRVIATYLTTVTFGLGLVGVWLGSTSDWVVRSFLLSRLSLRLRRQR